MALLLLCSLLTSFAYAQSISSTTKHHLWEGQTGKTDSAGVTTSFYLSDGPYIAEFTYNWIQIYTPTVVGTVFYTVNQTNGVTSSTTVYNTGFVEDGTTKIWTRTDTNELGTVTSSLTDYGISSIAYPTNFRSYNSSYSWWAYTATTHTNGSHASCCTKRKVFSETIPLPSTPPLTTTTDSADPSGWQYALIGGPSASSSTDWIRGGVVMLDNVAISEVWNQQYIGFDYTGCPYTECSPFSWADPVGVIKGTIVNVLDSTTTTLSSTSTPAVQAQSATLPSPTSTFAQAQQVAAAAVAASSTSSSAATTSTTTTTSSSTISTSSSRAEQPPAAPPVAPPGPKPEPEIAPTKTSTSPSSTVAVSSSSYVLAPPIQQQEAQSPTSSSTSPQVPLATPQPEPVRPVSANADSQAPASTPSSASSTTTPQAPAAAAQPQSPDPSVSTSTPQTPLVAPQPEPTPPTPNTATLEKSVPSSLTSGAASNNTPATLPAQAPKVDPTPLTIGSSIISKASSSYVIEGQTLKPGSTIQVSGTIISLAPSATQLIVGSSTRTRTTDGLGGYIWTAIGGAPSPSSATTASKTGPAPIKYTGLAARSHVELLPLGLLLGLPFAL